MAADILIPGGVVSMPGEAVERILSSGSGDAALLYLCLLRRGSSAALHWENTRLEAASGQLVKLGLASAGYAAPPPAPKEREEPPEYTAEDISRELENNSPFSPLVKEVERRLGKLLSISDLRMLYTIYDYLALPVEVILLLVTWCVNETERKYGAGRKPRMAQIRREAFIWHRCGVDTADSAEEHLKKLSVITSREAQLLSLVGIAGRPAVEGERNFLSAWVEMGFEDEAISLAYEKTVLKKQSMSWPYMNSILKSWHQKGLHTVKQIAAEDSAYRRNGTAAKTAPSQPGTDAKAQEDIRWMQEYMARERAREKGER